ncbi:MAG: aminotransferase class I/II-fold pyridoxal phosphate-dependent enzyme, partial [Deltaproteobacteria bacterium]|nr:aminotransferase class I/II-fold pyridoxal phosphate-dependent enzyme [Deltaproteobacteria bacterium]
VSAVLAIAGPSDEISLNLPYYFSHEMAVTIADCKPVCVPTDEDFQLQPDRIAEAITDRTRAVVTISPNNPTGVVYSESALRRVNEICRDKGIYHISDEAYEYFTYDGAKHFSPGGIEGAAEHTISLFSLSKAYGFASWRIGWIPSIPSRMAAPVPLANTFTRIPVSFFSSGSKTSSSPDACVLVVVDILMILSPPKATLVKTKKNRLAVSIPVIHPRMIRSLFNIRKLNIIIPPCSSLVEKPFYRSTSHHTLQRIQPIQGMLFHGEVR